MQSVYQYLDLLEQIFLQQLNRRHYDAIIPQMHYAMMSSLGSRIICWQFEQIVVYDVLTRTRHFFTDYRLERHYAAFACV